MALLAESYMYYCHIMADHGTWWWGVRGLAFPFSVSVCHGTLIIDGMMGQSL